MLQVVAIPLVLLLFCCWNAFNLATENFLFILCALNTDSEDQVHYRYCSCEIERLEHQTPGLQTFFARKDLGDRDRVTRRKSIS